MQIEGWKYYNHAAIPTCSPHEDADLKSIIDSTIWKIDGKPLLARWTSDFDCGYETEWWYCIKDTPFDIKHIKSKRPYEIKKGEKNFEVKLINPLEYIEDIISVQQLAWENYPSTYRPNEDREVLTKEINKWQGKVFGAFDLKTNAIEGYALINEHKTWADFVQLKVKPNSEKKAINAAIVAKILEYYNPRIEQGYYICDGERNIVHQTAFQNYLAKYFGFRKAYCKLNITYKKQIKVFVNILMPFKFLIHKSAGIKIMNNIDAILFMERIYRNQKENEYE